MPHPRTVPAALRAVAHAHPTHPPVVDGTTTLTFAELHRAVRDAARGYLALGLHPGERVCVWAPNTWEWVVAGLAVTYAGGVLVPVNTRYKGEEVADIVGIPFDEIQQTCPTPLAYTVGTDFKRAMRPDPDTIIHWDTW